MFYIYKVETADTGLLGNIIIVEGNAGQKVIDTATAVFYEYNGGDNPWQKPRPIRDSRRLVDYFKGSGTGKIPTPINHIAYDDINAARFEALQIQLGRSFRAQVNPGMPLAWVSFTQLLFVGATFLPKVMFFGSVYTLIAQAAVVVSALANNAPLIITACRVSTAVVIGNLLLCVLVWNSAYDSLDKFAAAYRTAIMLVSGVAIISSNQHLISIVSPYRSSFDL